MKSKTLAKDVFAFTKDVIIWSLSGGIIYQLFLCFLAVFMLIGVYAYLVQFNLGLTVTNMSDIVSWGFYIANFTFLVGMAAAAVMLVIPAYIYDWKPIREIVILGEIIAISAVIMCILFVMSDDHTSQAVGVYGGRLQKLNPTKKRAAWA